MNVRLKRVYDPPAPSDGTRILVDRMWPRGVKKEDAHIDYWWKDIAPSPELRKGFCHRPELFDAFREQYRSELLVNPVQRGKLEELRRLADQGPVTLVYAAKDPVYNHARVLLEVVNGIPFPE
ncbi:DUF488 domain-containing protein [Alicyclobacillus macrosporangiidus]|uniref:DUF488 domain-containing protein n=1 Tax=Alicyclobacillus macrosporangiidus TaxID=392015 RepID=UPI000497A245|nr:DUF488 domain-containing protein [Alicyclobacillus macrosporangiidus]MCL6597783.1 DUF488 domain-containing protein [Alicyclobacillus macrosporangiidus]